MVSFRGPMNRSSRTLTAFSLEPSARTNQSNYLANPTKFADAKLLEWTTGKVFQLYKHDLR